VLPLWFYTSGRPRWRGEGYLWRPRELYRSARPHRCSGVAPGGLHVLASSLPSVGFRRYAGGGWASFNKRRWFRWCWLCHLVLQPLLPLGRSWWRGIEVERRCCGVLPFPGRPWWRGERAAHASAKCLAAPSWCSQAAGSPRLLPLAQWSSQDLEQRGRMRWPSSTGGALLRRHGAASFRSPRPDRMGVGHPLLCFSAARALLVTPPQVYLGMGSPARWPGPSGQNMQSGWAWAANIGPIALLGRSWARKMEDFRKARPDSPTEKRLHGPGLG
jgi:hypothetical protein